MQDLIPITNEPTKIVWQRIMVAWEKSGETQKVFCERHKLKHSKFINWRSRLNKINPGSKSKGFSKICIKQNTVSLTPIIITAPNGYKISISHDLNETYLNLILNAVSAR